VSHDRYLLENVATEMAELSACIRWAAAGARELQRVPREERRFSTPSRSGRKLWKIWFIPNRVGCGECETRTRKSKARIDKAGELMAACRLEQPTRSETAQIDFSASDRKTKRLVELQNVSCEIGNRRLFERLNFSSLPACGRTS